MQLYVLLIIMGLLVGQSPELSPRPELGAGPMLWACGGPFALLAALAWGACRAVRRGMTRRPERATRLLLRLQATLNIMRWAAIGAFFSALFGLGLLTWLKEALGRVIIVPELIAMGLPLGVVVVMWWAYYPIEQRLREATLIRRLDQGEPLFPVGTRASYVIDQLRHQVLVVLAPMLLILLWVQFVGLAADRWPAIARYEAPLMAAGGLGVFAIAPLVIRMVWRTSPMPDGPLRERLVDLCRRHGVRVRELLLWHTHGGQINGAVMGLIGPLRYILLTDGLVEQMDDRKVEAVMAHELGHVRRKHMPWMAVCALGTLGAMFLLLELAAAAIDVYLGWDGLHEAVVTVGLGAPSAASGAVAGAAMLATLAAWAAVFGYISRRFERQADTFAVQHLAAKYPEARAADEPPGDEPTRIGPRAAADMADALEAVCRLNHVPTSRPSWRHGSIDWRIDYLRSLVGQRVDQCPIDRHVRRLCWAGGAMFLLTLAIEFAAML